MNNLSLRVHRLPLLLVLSLSIAILAGCAASDVVLQYSPGSLDQILKTDPARVGADSTGSYYQFSFDGITRILVSKDFKASGEADIRMETPLAPFTAAGLDASKLGSGYEVAGDTLTLVGDYGDGTGAKPGFREALFQAVAADRTNLTYHMELDHYGVKLPAGKFEWAKDHTKNDKDIVFILAAKPLADIGVDVEKIEGWVFLTMKDPDGSSTDVLVKPYDLP